MNHEIKAVKSIRFLTRSLVKQRAPSRQKHYLWHTEWAQC